MISLESREGKSDQSLDMLTFKDLMRHSQNQYKDFLWKFVRSSQLVKVYYTNLSKISLIEIGSYLTRYALKHIKGVVKYSL